MPQCPACSLQTDSFYTASVCRLPEEEEEEQQRGGRREGWENKASIVVSPAGPGRAELAGASYVIWLAGPTFLFRAAAHTNPHWGTSPALEKGVEGALREPEEKVWLRNSAFHLHQIYQRHKLCFFIERHHNDISKPMDSFRYWPDNTFKHSLF